MTASRRTPICIRFRFATRAQRCRPSGRRAPRVARRSRPQVTTAWEERSRSDCTEMERPTHRHRRPLGGRSRRTHRPVPTRWTRPIVAISETSWRRCRLDHSQRHRLQRANFGAAGRHCSQTSWAGSYCWGRTETAASVQVGGTQRTSRAEIAMVSVARLLTRPVERAANSTTVRSRFAQRACAKLAAFSCGCLGAVQSL